MSELAELDVVEPVEDKPLPRQTAQAQEQADEVGGLGRSAKVVAHKSGETFTVPSVLLLDDDQLVAYEELHHKLNQCDRYPDAKQPAQRFVHKNPDGTEVETEIGEHTQRGGFIQPYQKDGELITPPYSIQLAVIFWGDDGYQRFKAGGGRSAEIPEKLGEINGATVKRMADDSKSAASGSGLASGTDSDRS